MSLTFPVSPDRGRRGAEAIDYPDSDGKPIADNTLQFQYIVLIKEGLESLFADRSVRCLCGR